MIRNLQGETAKYSLNVTQYEGVFGFKQIVFKISVDQRSLN